jgi:TPR repeat protein
VTAFNRGDFGRAFRILLPAAESGDARAQYLIGTLYRLGNGTPRDEYRAFHWCRQAAEEGMLEAQYQLGLMYLQGEGVTTSEHRALEWLWRAADRGYPQATEVLEYILYSDFTFGC